MDREQALRSHQELVSQGWERRFAAQEPRLSEMQEFYKSLGLEVRVEDGGSSDDDQQCTSCFEIEEFSDLYKTIYTRRTEKTGTAEADELFE